MSCHSWNTGLFETPNKFDSVEKIITLHVGRPHLLPIMI